MNQNPEPYTYLPGVVGASGVGGWHTKIEKPKRFARLTLLDQRGEEHVGYVDPFDISSITAGGNEIKEWTDISFPAAGGLLHAVETVEEVVREVQEARGW